MSVEKIEGGSTLWGMAKQKLKDIQGEGAKITNQQIVDAMKAIAKANGQEDGDFDKLAKDKFNKIGETIEIPGLYVENGRVGVKNDEPPVAEDPATTEPPATEETATDLPPAEDNGSMVGQMGMTAFALKGMAKSTEYLARGYDLKYVKDKAKAQGKGIKDVAKKQFSKLEGKIAKAKAQNVRNTAAGKTQEYRKALNNWKAENDKLKELKAKQDKLKTIKKKMKDERTRLNKEGKNITDKALKTRNANRATGLKKGIEKADKEIAALEKEINKQKDIVGKANAKKVAAKEARDAAKRKVTKDVNKTLGRKASGKLIKKATTKEAAKAAAKAGGKTLAKKIPFVGAALGLGFAADRLAHGDVLGAFGEAASGIASCVPGIGTAVSVGIDVALAAKDLRDASKKA